jgi:hypothetical protein
MRIIFVILVVGLVLGLQSPVRGALAVGEVAIVAVNSNGTDGFAWVALANIAASATLKFTDSSWQGTSPGAFRAGESGGGSTALTWSHTSPVAAGTVIRYTGTTTNTWSVGTRGGSTIPLSTNGDQLFIFSGASTSPTFLYGLNFANTGWVASSTTSNSSNTSNIPGALTSGSTAAHMGNFDNGYYSGPLSGTPSTILTNLANASNWTRRNTTAYSSALWASSFTVSTSSAPEPSSLLMSGIAALLGGAYCRRRNAKVNAPNSPDAEPNGEATGLVDRA